jgi:hypothetical protein
VPRLPNFIVRSEKDGFQARGDERRGASQDRPPSQNRRQPIRRLDACSDSSAQSVPASEGESGPPLPRP